MRNGIRAATAVAALLASSSAFAQTGWIVSEASGQVVIRDATGDHAAVRGMTVPAGAAVLTAAKSHAVIVRGEDFVTLAPASRVRLPDATQSAGLFQMISEWGNAIFKIKHQPKPHFAVQTPYLAAVVKGTTFSITVSDAGSAVQVIDGAVEVATVDGGAHDLIRPGVVAMVAATDRFRLSINDGSSRAIDSPRRDGDDRAKAGPAPSSAATGGSPTAQSPASNGDESPAETVNEASATNATSTGKDDSIAWHDVADAIITEPIEAQPVDLGSVTDGMVTGQSGVAVALASLSPTSRENQALVQGSKTTDSSGSHEGRNDTVTETPSPAPGSAGTSADTGANAPGDNGTGNTGSTGNGNGTADAGNSNGNGNAGAGTGSTATGNDSAASGNSNAGSNNAGGNGNGNAGSSNNAGGNGNGNAVGNGHSSSVSTSESVDVGGKNGPSAPTILKDIAGKVSGVGSGAR